MIWVRRGAALFSGGALLLGSSLALAETPEQPLRIQYEAHEGCPDALSFFWHVRARTQRLRLAEPGELAVLASVHITRDGAGPSVGTLGLPELQGQPFVRRVEASSCGEVVLALSLVLALAYDPDAIAVFPAPAEPASPPPAPAPPVVPPPPPPPAPVAPAVRVGVGAEAVLLSSIAPGLSSAFGPFIEAGASGDSLRGGWWRPRGVATLLVEAPDATASVSAAGARRSATLSYVGGRLAGCPGSYGLSRGLEVGPCVGLTAGRIGGSGGTGLSPASSDGAFWAAAELMAALRWDVAGPFFVQALGGAGFSLFRPIFALHTGTGSTRPDLAFHTVPLGFGELGLSLGAHFP